MQRNHTLDLVRTIAIVLMVVFHFIYDLRFFGWIDWNTPDGPFWREFRWLIITLFFLCLGVSLCFAHEAKFRPTKFAIRVGQIAAGAAVISIATYFAIPENWIFFGVLHFLALSSLICVGFIHMPKLSFVIGCTLMLAGIFKLVPSRWPFHLFFDSLPSYTNDYVAIIPWLGMVFFGITLGHSKYLRNDPLNFLKHAQHHKLLVWPGKNSLMIYLLHQPIMIGAMYLISLGL